MNAPHLNVDECRHFAPLLEPLRDGELDPVDVVEVEQHLQECARCSSRMRLGEALRRSLQRAVLREASVSSAFEERVRAAMTAELARETALESAADAPAKMLTWRSIVPIVAAAASVLVWAGSANRSPSAGPANDTRASQAGVPVSVEALLDELVSNHERASSPQITEASLLPQLEPEVGVPLRVPNLKQYGARWEGISVVPMNNQRAASLRYRMGTHRLTLYVYDSSRFPVSATLKARTVRDEPVYVGSRHGVQIAATERRGRVGYALATDLNDAESAELVASIY